MKSAQRHKRSIRMIVLIVCVSAVIALIGYLWYGHINVDYNWKPTKREPAAKIIFNGEWGQDIGLHRATGKEGDVFNYGFRNFCVKNDKIYIADTINEHVSIFINSKLMRMYNYSTEILRDAGLAATDRFIYLLDDRGYISKIDINSGEYVLRKHVIENPNGLLTENEYTIYTLDQFIVINDDLYTNKCFSSDNLSEVACPFANITDPDQRKKFIYLSQNYYASILADEIFLHDANGKKIGRVVGISEHDVQYDIRRNYQVELNGVYYLKRSSTGAQIYFKPWQR